MLPTESRPRSIAIIGTGISGLAAASLLHPHHNITIYEKNDYVGGHSRTVEVETENGLVAVDTGFIVFNKRNYPLLTRLFDHLGVPISESDMSFGASIDGGWLEYGTRYPTDLLAQLRNLCRPAFWGMVADILKFNRSASVYLQKDPSFTLGECLEELKLRKWFKQYYLLAMGGAIWSTPLDEMLKFPACTFVRFFENHGLLTMSDHPQWYTVRGGSREYVRRLVEPFKERVHLNRGAQRVWRDGSVLIVEDVHGNKEPYTDVVLACHADQAMNIIDSPTDTQREVLSAIRYQPNRAVLHCDLRFMPKRRKAWASWVYLAEGREDASPTVSLSYWMNNLQPLATSKPLIVTLNPGREPDPHLVYNDFTFEHPVFDERAIKSQEKIDAIQGQNRLWFCGAYQRYGFHEDGIGSAVRMAKQMGVEPTW